MPSVPAKPVTVAVVGLGYMGATHLRAHLENPEARVAAVCDPNRQPVSGVLPGVAGNIKMSGDIQLGTQVKVFQRIEDLLADSEVELVDLCTPTPLHPRQAIAVLEAGKNVICEKPLARTSALAREILKVAEQSPGILMPAMCMRFWPGWGWLKNAVTEQTYGRILAAGFRRLSEMPAWSQQGTYSDRSDLGGALFDLHIHDTDFINYLFGRPASVFSSGVTNSTDTITHVLTQYNYRGGPVVHAEGSWLLRKGFHMSYTLHCERATLDYDLSRGAEAMVVTEAGNPPRVVRFEESDGYGAELRYIVRCVAHHQTPNVVTVLDGVTGLEICEAEERSIRTSREVKCDSPKAESHGTN